jgi:hypothetical protein
MDHGILFRRVRIVQSMFLIRGKTYRLGSVFVEVSGGVYDRTLKAIPMPRGSSYPGYIPWLQISILLRRPKTYSWVFVAVLYQLLSSIVRAHPWLGGTVANPAFQMLRLLRGSIYIGTPRLQQSTKFAIKVDTALQAP